MKKKKAYVFLLAILIFSYGFSIKFSLAILGGLGSQKVPVLDSAANEVLINIDATLKGLNKILTEQLQDVNDHIRLILNSLTRERVDKFFLDAIRQKSFPEHLVELEKIISANRVEKFEDIKDEIDEAVLAGIYEALENFDTLPCLPLGMEDEIYSFTLNFISSFTDVDFSEKLSESIANIPICEPMFSGGFLVVNKNNRPRESLLAKLFRPFNLSLLVALIGPSNGNNQGTPPNEEGEEEDLEENVFSITPAHEETYNSIRFSELQSAIVNLIVSSVNAKVAERVAELAKVKPIEECLEYTFLKDGENKGKFICLRYKKVVDLRALDEALQRNRLLMTNPLSANSNDSAIYSQNLMFFNLLSNLGLTSSTLAIFSEIDDPLALENREELKKMIDQICSYLALEKNIEKKFEGGAQQSGENVRGSRTVAYIECLRMVQEKLKMLVEMEKKRIQQMASSTVEIKRELVRLQGEANRLKERAERGGCRGAAQDLEKKITAASSSITIIDERLDFIEDIALREIIRIQISIAEAQRELINIIDRLYAEELKFIAKIDEKLKNLEDTLDAFNSIISNLVPNVSISPAKSFINQIREVINILSPEKLKNEVAKFFTEVNQSLTNISTDILNFNRIKVDMINEEHSISLILNEKYKIAELEKQLKAYRAFVENEENCPTTQPSSVTIKKQIKPFAIKNQTKPKTIVVVEKPKQEKGIFARFFDIFKWKSFEFTFQR
jgi:hypothetical protein